MSLPFSIDTRFLTEPYIGDGSGLTEGEIDRYRSRGARCLREMRKSKKAGRLPHYARNRSIRSTIREIRSHADRLARSCKTLLLVGIGGSSNGTRAIAEALLPAHWNELSDEARQGRPRFHVLDNVDPRQISDTLAVLDLTTTVVNVVSRSGSTAEVVAIYGLIRERMEQADPEGWRKRVIITTASGSSYLRSEIETHGYRNLAFPEEIGGRWSVLTAVGLFPAAMLGLDIGRFIDGASEVELLCTEADIDVNPALRAALLYYLMDLKKKKKVQVLFTYANRLMGFGRWFQQLWAESLGKAYAHTGKEVHAGPIPVVSLGVCDQHSMLQLYLEGPLDKVVTFLTVRDHQDELAVPGGTGQPSQPAWLLGRRFEEIMELERLGTSYALAADGRPLARLELNRIDEFSLGALFYFWELVVSYLATLYGVDAFDQPAVELGKWATRALMGDPEHAELVEEVRSTLALDEPEEADEEAEEEAEDEEEAEESVVPDGASAEATEAAAAESGVPDVDEEAKAGSAEAAAGADGSGPEELG